MSLKSLAKMIDHSLLHPTLTNQELEAGCELAKKYDVATVCVKPYFVGHTAIILQNSGVEVCSVVSFPHGNSPLDIKLAETEMLLENEVTEIDMVVNIGAVLGKDWQFVSKEIKAMNDLVTSQNAILKVIFENDYLSTFHIIQLCKICSSVGVAFVKTSTGYGFVKQENGMYAYKGATDAHLKFMRTNCAPNVKIKAAGGVRTLDDLLRVRELGVTRVGATAIASILDTAKEYGIK